MIRVAWLRCAIVALAGVMLALVVVPAMGEQASAVQPSLTLKDAPVQDVIRMIARALGADLLMTDDVKGTISLEVSQKTPEEILDIICTSNKLYWWKDKGVYVVSGTPRGGGAEAKPAQSEPLPRTLRADNERSVIPLQYLNAQDLAYLFGGAKEPHNDAYRTMQKVIYPYGAPGQPVGQSLGAQKSGQAVGAKAKTAAAVSSQRNPFEELSQVQLPGVIEPAPTGPEIVPGEEEQAAAEQQFISPGAPLAHLLPEGLTPPVAFAPLNALIVQGPPERIEEFRKLVELLDVRVPQVMVEAQFVEMRVEDARKFGIDWSWISGETSIDVTGIAAGGNVGISFAKGKFSALLQALLNTQQARVINAPRLATMNNQPVTFTISRTFFYFTTSTVVQPPGFAGSQVITSEVLNALPVQTTFTILPQVNGDNSITVDVTTVISDIAGYVTSPSGEQIPQPTATALPTRLRVEDGDTIVMGGFIRKNVSTSMRKVPLLSDIPIIGKALFTGTTYDYSDSELLIFLTAYIMPEKGTAVSGAKEGERVPYMVLPLGK
jgi:type II secretory pathway component GspD/PulD (secretin)